MEIIGSDFRCNLGEVHLINIDPFNFEEQYEAFYAGGLSCCALLQLEIIPEKFRYSKDIDPIVGVSFTGLFDFFVAAFGVRWLEWWNAGRPDKWGELVPVDSKDLMSGVLQESEFFTNQEVEYLTFWRMAAEKGVEAYCTRNGIRIPNRCTTVQPAGCGSKDSLRTFDSGLLYPDEIVSPNSGESEGQYYKTTALSVRSGISLGKAIANDKLNLVRIKLNNGRTIRVTENHKFSIDNNWVEAKDLKVGDRLEYSLGEYINRINLPLATGESFTDNVNTPSSITPKLAYLVGLIFSNGCFTENKNRVRIFHGNLEILENAKTIFKELFPESNPIISKDSRHEGKELTVSDAKIFSWFKQVDLFKDCSSKELYRVPKKIRLSSRESVIAFIAGYIDGDGCIHSNNAVSIESSSYKILDSIQQVAEAVGLAFSLNEHKKSDTSYSDEPYIYNLGLSRMVSLKESLETLNLYLTKGKVELPRRFYETSPYEVKEITFEVEPDYSYDFEINGKDYDDSWCYWGGLKSHNTKSLLTGSSPGWHPPKAARYIRRITMKANDAVALASRDYGYNIVPSQSCKDEEGNLLNDPYDSRVNEWLIEIPVEVPWADIADKANLEIEKFSAEAQFKFYTLVQKYYTGHNTSATIELYEHEIETLGNLIYENIINGDGYISAALLARDNAPYPRLPFEKISKEEYEKLSKEVLSRRLSDDFYELLKKYDTPEEELEGPAQCDSTGCLIPSKT